MKLSKKIMSIILTILLILLCNSVAFAENISDTLVISSKQTDTDTLVLTLGITDTPIVGLICYITYDTDKLTFIPAVNEHEADSSVNNTNLLVFGGESNGQITCSATGAIANNKSGTLINYTFKIKDNVQDGTILLFETDEYSTVLDENEDEYNINKSYSATVQKKCINHDFVEIKSSAPTCTTEGYSVKKCSNCNYEEKNIIKASGHKTKLVHFLEPTAITSGYTGDTVCTECNTVISWGDTIPKLGLTGDLNDDDKVTTKDARLLLRFVAQLTTLSDYQKNLADINNDGKITTKDARLILRAVAKLETI